MKKLLVSLLLLLLAIPVAHAKKIPMHVYDADEHDYEGRVVWTSDSRCEFGDEKHHEVLIMHTLNLKTGKYTLNEMCDAYVIQGDAPEEGFLAAREREGRVWIYNIKTGFESELLFTCELAEGWWYNMLPATVRAYMDGYLYYIVTDGNCQYSLARRDAQGNEYIYSAPEPFQVSINPNGCVAWETDDDSRILVESPEKGIFMELPAADVENSERVFVSAWLNEKKLLFWRRHEESNGGTLYTLNVENGAVKKYTDKKGRDITNSKYSPYETFQIVGADKKSLLYMHSYCVWDSDYGNNCPILLDLETGEHTMLYHSGKSLSRILTRDIYVEYVSEGSMAVWFAE